jgi:hypothetical protein
MFTIYRHPSDYPGKWVVRRWEVGGKVDMAQHGTLEFVGGTPLTSDRQPLAVVDTLDAARAAVPAGLYNLGREGADDPAIYEVWV